MYVRSSADDHAELIHLVTAGEWTLALEPSGYQ